MLLFVIETLLKKIITSAEDTDVKTPPPVPPRRRSVSFSPQPRGSAEEEALLWKMQKVRRICVALQLVKF